MAAQHNRAIDFSKLENLDIEYADDDKQTDTIDFRSLLWIQIGSINKILAMHRMDILSTAVDALEINLIYYLKLDNEYVKRMNEINEKFDKIKNKIPAKDKQTTLPQIEGQYSKEKFEQIMYFLGKRGWLV